MGKYNPFNSKVILILFIFTLSFVTVLGLPINEPSNCDPDFTKFQNVNNFSMDNLPGASTLVGNDKIVEFISGENKFYYHILDGLVNNFKESESDYILTTDDCTIERILDGSTALSEYEEGNIKLKGTSFGTKLKAGLGKLFLNVYSWF